MCEYPVSAVHLHTECTQEPDTARSRHIAELTVRDFDRSLGSCPEPALLRIVFLQHYLRIRNRDTLTQPSSPLKGRLFFPPVNVGVK